MKILIPVDPEIPVPPPLYGGVERLVDGLITEYSKAGHEVILLAHSDSTAKAAVRKYAWPVPYTRGHGNILKNAMKLFRVARKEKPDVIHSFCRLLYLYPSVVILKNRAVMTYGRYISPKSTALASVIMGKRIAFTSAAAHMLDHLKKYRNKFTPIYNFTPVEYFVPDVKRNREYLMFLGRVEDIKGTWECIQVALRTGSKLVIAGNIQPGHDDYFNTKINPFLDDPLIEYIGPVDDETKRYYLQGAKALLFPIKWEEPFGIVMAEAMSCGTPVIAFRRGSVPEVVIDGFNGYITNNMEEMCESIAKLEQLDPEVIRKDCVSRFSREKITTDYLKVLEKHRRK